MRGYAAKMPDELAEAPKISNEAIAVCREVFSTLRLALICGTILGAIYIVCWCVIAASSPPWLQVITIAAGAIPPASGTLYAGKKLRVYLKRLKSGRIEIGASNETLPREA